MNGRGAKEQKSRGQLAIGNWQLAICISLFLSAPVFAAKLLIPMDLTQTDHLKAYGIAYWTIEKGQNVEWLLNYRGGSFMMEDVAEVERECRLRDVAYLKLSGAEATRIYGEFQDANMDRILLEKAPRIAVYSPPNKQPWDDAVTLALSYAEIPYETLWDEDVYAGKLSDFDWLHLHHEDFTGQYGKFFRSHGTELWYRQQQAHYETMAKRNGFSKVSHAKGAIVFAVVDFMREGGFVFAMCSATDTFDIALAAKGVDIVDIVYDGDSPDAAAQAKLDFKRTVAFENFHLVMNPMEYEHSDIDISPTGQVRPAGPEADAFTLFEFSAKYDPVPTMLTQNHVPVVKGFLGQTTAFKKRYIKKSVTILGELTGTERTRYIHGSVGKGMFTFFAGHDPEDYQHFVGDPPTQLTLRKNSPGYRLILNNILFPAARKQKRKT